jgi:flavin reductase (DIM6/NTAB) family NADH-FMN oxidoreductase RutF
MELLISKETNKILPLPVAIITSLDSNGIHNAAPFSCIMPVYGSKNLISFSSALPRDTVNNIRATGHYVINVMGRPGFKESLKSAGNYLYDENELEKANINTDQSEQVKALRIKDAIGWIECKFEREVPGDNYSIIIGQMVLVATNQTYAEQNQAKELPLVLLNNDFMKIGNSIRKKD